MTKVVQFFKDPTRLLLKNRLVFYRKSTPYTYFKREFVNDFNWFVHLHILQVYSLAKGKLNMLSSIPKISLVIYLAKVQAKLNLIFLTIWIRKKFNRKI